MDWLKPYIEHSKNMARADDYKGEDGFMYCSKCNTVKQLVIPNDGRIAYKMCLCMELENTEREKAEDRQEFLKKVEARKKSCYDGIVNNNSFISSEQTDTLKIVERWCRADKPRNRGLLLYGGLGTGKTHLAQCACNYFLKKGYTCKFINTGNFINQIFSADDKDKYMRDLYYSKKLIVIDDLGAERNSEYAQGEVYNLINNIYESGKKIILTTNLTPEQLREPKKYSKYDDVEIRKRTYDRLFEMCHFLSVDGADRRAKIALEKQADIKKILGG